MPKGHGSQSSKSRHRNHTRIRDGPWGKKEDILIPAERFTVLDLETFQAPESERYDLAISLEVAEHLHEKAADNFFRQLTRLSDRILFSAAIPGQGGLHHLNERSPGYWAEKFRDCGFTQLDILRPRFLDDDRIAWWYRQNFFLYKTGYVRPRTKRSRSNIPSTQLTSSTPMPFVKKPKKWTSTTPPHAT